MGRLLGKLWGSFVICLHPVAMDEAEVKEMKDSLQQKVTATEVKVAIATAKKEIQDQFFRLTRALEGKVDQSFEDALSSAVEEVSIDELVKTEVQTAVKSLKAELKDSWEELRMAPAARRRRKNKLYKQISGVSRTPDKPTLLADVS